MKKKRLILLGCTGSIGTTALNVCRELKDRIEIVGLSTHTKVDKLIALGQKWRVTNLAFSGDSRPKVGIPHNGLQGLKSMIEETAADIVLNGIAGTAGFLPSLWALKTGKNLALANKETIIMGGELVKKLARKKGRLILPVDSEHSALHHLLRGDLKKYTEELVLTASGGPFRLTSKRELARVSLKEALNHPTWNMGPKITIDSATLANKGLEIMEAHFLFDMAPEKIKVIIHPQSHVHSLIRTVDGVLYAQISEPSMIHPIQNALTFPQITPSKLKPLDLAGTELTFHPVDQEKFPLIPLAYQALKAGGAFPLAYNAANEVAVEAFLREEISYLTIPRIVENVLQKDWSAPLTDFDQIIELDMDARKQASWLLPNREVV